MVPLTRENAGRIDLQSKTKAGLSTSPDSPLGKTIIQLVRVMIEARTADIAVDPAKVRAVLAVAANAPRTLDGLERACRAFDLGGIWATTKAGRSSAERQALDLFETHARTAWATHSPTPPTDYELATVARLFRIVRFSMNEGEDNWREASRIRSSLFELKLPHARSEHGVVTLSTGISTYPGSARRRTVEQLLSRADVALYNSKAAGRNRVTGWRPSRELRRARLSG